MPPRRSSASRSSVQIGSSVRLPLVATTREAEVAEQAGGAAACRAASRPGRDCPARRRRRRALVAASRRRSSTIGASGAAEQALLRGDDRRSFARGGLEGGRTSGRGASPRGASARAAGAPRSSSRASTIRWKPPSALTATIAAACAARPRPGGAPILRARGAHPAAPAQLEARARSRGQALGWAWKRRSAGSSYSARQARTSRSRPSWCSRGRRGAPRMMLKRGPQFVQLVKG